MKLSRKEKNVIVFLLNARRPVLIWQLAQWMGIGRTEAGKIVSRLTKGLRIKRNEKFEFFLVVETEEQKSKTNSKIKNEQGRLF